MNKSFFIAIIVGVCLMAVVVIFWQKGILTSVQPKDQSMTQQKRLQVVASFYPVYFLAERIGGEKANVINITPAGSEPHDYEPTSQDMAAIERSQLIILNGGNLEAWRNNIEQSIDPERTKVVVAGEGLADQQVEENGKQVVDPHIWLDPLLAKKMTEKIVEGFALVDPTNSEYYQENATTLEKELEDLDMAYREGLNNCVNKDIITSHSAFGYLASEYGLRQVSIAGLSPDAEPSLQELASVTQFAKANSVRYIFFESLVSPKLAQTIAREVGAQTLVLNPIEGLTDEEVAQGKDYFSEMTTNLTHLKIALQCVK